MINSKTLPTKSNSSEQPLTASSEKSLAEHAKAIRALHKRAIADVIEIGKRLTEAKGIAGHGNWLPWLRREFAEFGWTDKTAETYMNIYKARASGKFEVISNLDVSVTNLALLAAPSTPPDAVETVANRTKAGEKLTGAEVKNIVAKTKAMKADPPPAKTPKQSAKARETEHRKLSDERLEKSIAVLEGFIKEYSNMPVWQDLITAIYNKLHSMKETP